MPPWPFPIESRHLVYDQSSRGGFDRKCRLAAPTSYCALRFRCIVLGKRELRHGNHQHRGFLRPIRVELHQRPERLLKILRVVFRCHDIRPRLLVAARRCPSRRFNRLRSTSCGTALSLKARGSTFWISSCTGKFHRCGLLIFVLHGKQAALFRSLLHHLQVDRDRHSVADDDSAAIQVCIPLHAKVLPVHVSGCTYCGARVAPGIFYRSRRASASSTTSLSRRESSSHL